MHSRESWLKGTNSLHGATAGKAELIKINKTGGYTECALHNNYVQAVEGSMGATARLRYCVNQNDTITPAHNIITLPMLRLLSCKAQGLKTI